MTSSSARPERAYHQDYIARIRYSNALPPPPNPPKLLEIPNTGLAGGQYTSAGFASRLAREQPLNIEADAELGMPIDLVGMPGVFDGDESSIQPQPGQAIVHPRDRALLRPLSTLGKPTSVTAGVSFLRRTEYISSEQGRSRFESTTSKNLIRSTNLKKRRRSDVAQDDPINILRSVVKGFDLAYPNDAYKGPDTEHDIRGSVSTQAEIDSWTKPKHPTRPNLSVVDSYPILPDLDAFPDSGGYMLMKFATNPVAPSDTYDSRLEVGLLKPLDPRPEVLAAYEAQQAAHEADPAAPPPQAPLYDYAYFLPEDISAAKKIQKKFSVDDPENDLAELYTNTNEDGDPTFRYDRVRAYETAAQTSDTEHKLGDLAVALHDPEAADAVVIDGDAGQPPTKRRRLQKAAYFYPILQKSQIRPLRAGKLAGLTGVAPGRSGGDDDRDKVDALSIMVRSADAAEEDRRASHRAEYGGDVGAEA